MWWFMKWKERKNDEKGKKGKKNVFFYGIFGKYIILRKRRWGGGDMKNWYLVNISPGSIYYNDVKYDLDKLATVFQKLFMGVKEEKED